ncbi:MAG: hypothetical protein AAFO72_12680 [Pseudomonadota bacterium]
MTKRIKSGKGWHLVRGEGFVLLARRWPARFDVCAMTILPPMRLVPLVHMVRQDIWRALRRLRGFSPVVEARVTDLGVSVTAGGQVSGPLPAKALVERLRAVLDHAPNRERWHRCAR